MSKDLKLSYRIFEKTDELPDDAREAFAEEIQHCSEAVPEPDAQAQVLLVVALTDVGRMAGGAFLNIGSIGGGPLQLEKMAVLERIVVQPSFQRQGVGSQIMAKACEVARGSGCRHIQTCANWDCPAELAFL